MRIINQKNNIFKDKKLFPHYCKAWTIVTFSNGKLWLNINHRRNRAACSPTEEYLISQMTDEMLIYK